MSSEFIIVVWRLSSKFGKLESSLALRGLTETEVLVTVPCGPGELRGSHFGPLYIISQESGLQS